MTNLTLAAVALAAVLAAAAAAGSAFAAAEAGADRLVPALERYLDDRAAERDEISAERRAQLDELAAAIRERHAAGEPVRLNFVCTHNSRRSHMAQLSAAAAAVRTGIDARCYSGGTEATAFNPRAVAAAERAGFEITKTTEDANPIYHTRFAQAAPPQTNFSKPYDAAPNPASAFIAVMVCGSADESCPTVYGADARFAITYTDPKASDGTPAEAATYDERLAQISRELLYVFESAADPAG